MTTINTEEIIKQIQQDIAEKGYDESLLHFSEVDLQTTIANQDCYNQELFERQVARLNTDYNIILERPSQGNPIKKAIQKLMRKLIRFYIEPVVKDQVQYNSLVTQTMNQVRLYQLQELQDIQELNASHRDASYDLTKQIRDLENELQAMQLRVTSLEKQLGATKEDA